ncbi:MAG: fumarylacetoacetate hydrolase family protein [Candidatus Sulfotelmatobacter sp.]|jgi:2-keto-4-pentenoate hydratase/2-oxohepta-3-ene-1,7-dioic acid hydratase in catechol pathway
MRLARFSHHDKIGYGIVQGQEVCPVKGDIFAKQTRDGEPIPMSKVRFLVPSVATKVIALGINYRTHAEELKIKIPDEPLFFYKPPSSLIGTRDCIQYPPQSKRVDYEAELAFVIGKTAKNVPVSRALDYILGYTCFNDVTARDIQCKDGGLELVKSKAFDTFGVVGPWIETEIDPGKLTIECLVNGVVKQAGNTSDLIFGVAETLSYISTIMTLCPGDIIATGTPSGIGPLSVGDVVSVRLEGVGTLENTVVRATANSGGTD